MNEAIETLETPIGRLRVVASDAGVTRVELPGTGRRSGAPSDGAPAQARRHARAAARALREYFAGARKEFDDLVLAPEGTPFERRVWRALVRIPFGSTDSYGALARRIGREGAARAVGRANGRNPIAIVVPCHRVIGADGSLTGYAGGLARKRWLLRHEGAPAD